MKTKNTLPKKIYKDDDTILRKYSIDVKFPLDSENLNIIKQLQTYLSVSNNLELNKEYNLKPAVGISAVQIGYLKKIVVLNFNYENIKYNNILINPKIISHNDHKCFIEGGEGCLSVSKIVKGSPIYRFSSIVVKYQDEKNNTKVLKFEGFPAIVVQHEIDHLLGILFTDYLDNIVKNDPGIEPTIIRR